MAISNTSILIKRSTTIGTPGSLKSGELAYSYASNTIFIGSPSGTGVVNVGGQFYTSQIDNATDQATALTIVRRDATGNASFNYITANIIGTISGNANSATQLQTARDFSISGTDITASATSFNGTSNVILNAALNAVPGLSAGTYGSNTAIPVLTIGANGRILGVTTNVISTDLSIAGDTGTDTINLELDTLTFAGGDGITSTVTNNNVNFDIDNTVVRANTPISIQTIDGAIQINGNLTVLGTQTTINTQTLNIADPLLYLASNNYSSDIVDIGFLGNYYDGSTQRHAGVFRNAGNKEFYIFDNYDKEPDSNNDINVGDASFRLATVHANLVSTIATVGTLSLTNSLTVPNGGTGKTSFLTGEILIGSGTNGLTQLANVSSINTSIASNNTVNNLTTDVYGRVTTYTTQAIGGLTVGQGGTGATAFNSGSIVIGNGTNGLSVLSNTTFVAIGSGASNNTISSVTVDAYGRFTDATYTAISGLTVPQGGTGLSSITSGGITYGNGVGTLGVTAAAGTSDQTWSNQILTTTNAGVPVWSTSLDGGSF